MNSIYDFLILMRESSTFAIVVYIILIAFLLVVFRLLFKNGKQIVISNIALVIMLFFTILLMSILLFHLFFGYPEGNSFIGDATNFATIAGLFYIIEETNQKLKRERQNTKQEGSREFLVGRNKELETQVENLQSELKEKNEELKNCKNDLSSINESLRSLERSFIALNTKAATAITANKYFNERLEKVENFKKRKSVIYTFLELILKK
ncbi:hypothetical protein [Planococcus sp. S3-L1]|uniref:hypothetical protein n=1 Tax=Planococcus sp. S3-L1 TaxID=3046200 RepID=UPI0024B8F932|nr:hypothetical protein [Planococcus sp. S3-L1]MDJ0333023.1 hypothetical protein [Planococcus sp. S3-L1]